MLPRFYLHIGPHVRRLREMLHYGGRQSSFEGLLPHPDCGPGGLVVMVP